MHDHAVGRDLSPLQQLGADPDHLVDLAEPSWRSTPYLDLVRSPPEFGPPLVFETQNRPTAYVFSHAQAPQPSTLKQWIRRAAFRGDADWVVVHQPGSVSVYPAALTGNLDPAPFTRSPLLFAQLANAVPDSAHKRGVHQAIFNLLHQSVQQAMGAGMSGKDALSLVGRGVFWRFLMDRGLLDRLDLEGVCPGATSLEDCMSSKTHALKTFRWLDETFNGGMLPFSSRGAEKEIPADVYKRTLGNIANAAAPDGQLELRLPTDWRQLNFSHLPVGLLSEVYEAHATVHHKHARAESIHYTPRHIAEFMTRDALAGMDHVEHPRVLDPAAGAGVFLVTVFRQLVARQWKATGQRPPRKAIRSILNGQLVGFDINEDALRLAELALYLTAIELDPEKSPKPLNLLKFDALWNKALVPVARPLGSLGPVDPRFRNAFDLVIGNPPWTAEKGSSDNKPSNKKAWADASRPLVRERLGERRARAFTFPDANPDLPFVYRAMEWAKPEASIALVTHARWLFSQQKAQARADLLQSVQLTGVLNCAGLTRTSVWPSVEAPFALVFARNTRAPTDAAFHYVSPALAEEPAADQVHLRIDWSDSRNVAVDEVIETPWMLKTRFRGTSMDASVLRRLLDLGQPLASFLSSKDAAIHKGYIRGGTDSSQEDASRLHGVPHLQKRSASFLLDVGALPRFATSSLHMPRARGIYRAPLLLIAEAIPIERTSPRTTIAMEDVVFTQSYSGISFAGIPDGEALARYIQLVVQSSLATYFQLLTDSRFGVERNVGTQESLEALPVIPWEALRAELQQRARNLSGRLHQNATEDVLREVDRFACDAFDLSRSERESIEDTLRVAMPDGPSRKASVVPPSSTERSVFLATLQEGLTEAGLPVNHVHARPLDRLEGSPWQLFQVWLGGAEPPVPADLPALLKDADAGAASLIKVLNAKGTGFTVGLLNKGRYWTRTRARMLAWELLQDDVFGEAYLQRMRDEGQTVFVPPRGAARG